MECEIAGTIISATVGLVDWHRRCTQCKMWCFVVALGHEDDSKSRYDILLNIEEYCDDELDT